jgi:hypothetical protein
MTQQPQMRVAVRRQEVVPRDEPRTWKWRNVVDREQVRSHACGFESQRFVVSEAGDEVHVTVEEPIDLVELRVLSDRHVILGQPPGFEKREQGDPRRTKTSRRPDPLPGQTGRIRWDLPDGTDNGDRKRLIESGDVLDGDPARARDHHIGRIGHSEVGLAVGDESDEVAPIGMLDGHVKTSPLEVALRWAT